MAMTNTNDDVLYYLKLTTNDAFPN